jgi:hypothetical protein
MKMFDHDPTATVQEHVFAGNQIWTEWAPMLALRYPDPALALPEGTELEPQVLIRNTTGNVQVANVTLLWRNEANKGQFPLPQFQLNPYETRLIDVKDLQVQGKIPPEARWALVKLSSPTAKPDDIMAIASSYDSTGRYGTQTPFFDQLASHWAAGAFEVAPGDQAWINVAELIHGQLSDAKGAKFPANITAGSYDVRQRNGAGNPSLLENKIIVDKTYGHLAYGCGGCCEFCSASLYPDPYTDAVGNGTWNTVLGQDCCDQWQDDVTYLTTGWGE